MEAAEIYQNHLARHRQAARAAAARSVRLSNLRLAAFLPALAFAMAGTLAQASSAVLLACFLLAGAFLVWFVRLVLDHREVIAEQEQLQRLQEMNEQALHRLNREWALFPAPAAAACFEQSEAAKDLDLFGAASLFHLVCTHHTPQGRHTLARWFCEPAPPSEVHRRQQAVEALAPELEWRQQLSVRGACLEKEEAEFLIPRWSRAEPWFHTLPNWFATYLKWCPGIFFLLLVLFVLFKPAIPAFLAVIAVNLWFSRKYRAKIHETLKDVGHENRRWRNYAALFRFIETCPARGGNLASLKNAVREAAAAMDELNHLATASLARHSIVHPLLKAIAAWDFRVVRSLETWQQTHGDQAEKWFTALGQFEALCSLASIRFDEPHWEFPRLSKDLSVFSAQSLGHPLIAAGQRVSNPVSLGPGGRFLLVTGSNMSGKSTLLRSIGLNVTLGQAGGPCCASALSFPPLVLATSMRVQDSLADGLSFFMAELQRIKRVVLAAKECQDRGQTLIFLLDEILQGTNSVERREIVRRIVSILMKSGAIGAITTHDLALAEMDDLTVCADLIHFREEFSRNDAGKPQMTFDYKIRPGIATTTNALKILEVIEMPV